MEAARDLVTGTSELPAGVQLGQDDRQRRHALFGHHVHRNPRSVVRDGHRVIRVDDDFDKVVSPRECFVDRVIDDLVDKVMESARTGRADVHPRPQANRFKAL